MPWCVYIVLGDKPEPDLSECKNVRDFRDVPKKNNDLDWPDLVAYPPGNDVDRRPADMLAARLTEEGYLARTLEYLRL